MREQSSPVCNPKRWRNQVFHQFASDDRPAQAQERTQTLPFRGSLGSSQQGYCRYMIKRYINAYIIYLVGGIYTVLKTKVPITVQEYTQERYCLIGPYNARFAQLEVEPLEKVPSAALQSAIDQMRSQGIHVVFGKWLIESSPYVVLFDLGSAWSRLNEWKSDLWNVAGIPAPENDTEMNDAIVFGYLVAWLLGEFCHQNKRQAVIAHFHEWMASAALVLINKRCLDIATIFTTHATLLGRYLCAGSVDFYNHLHLFDVDYEAGRRGIYHRYCLERGATHCADVFTTVSHITAYEAENLLKRKPDGVLPNGLNVVKFRYIHKHVDELDSFSVR